MPMLPTSQFAGKLAPARGPVNQTATPGGQMDGPGPQQAAQELATHMRGTTPQGGFPAPGPLPAPIGVSRQMPSTAPGSFMPSNSRFYGR